jgi:hypothetical protein
LGESDPLGFFGGFGGALGGVLFAALLAFFDRLRPWISILRR